MPLQIKLAVLCIMPIALSAVRASAQMVPVAETSTVFAAGSGNKLYTLSSDTASVPQPAIDPLSSSSLAEPATLSATTLLGISASSLSSEAALPQPLAAAPAPAGAPVTLPPEKPKKVRDLPPIQGDTPRVRPFRAAAFGLTASTLGTGGELAIPVARTLNLRVGGSYLRWQYPFNVDGIDFNPSLKFTSGRATVDWFPHHGAFHLSAGALYFRNNIAGSADVVEGQSFSLGGTTYLNSVDDPIHGAAQVTYGKQIAPMLLLGFGNILPRNGRHLSVPVEFGGAYMQPPSLTLKLSGTACTTQGCFNAATDSEVRANITKEETTLQNDIRFLQVYPIVSIGLACRF